MNDGNRLFVSKVLFFLGAVLLALHVYAKPFIVPLDGNLHYTLSPCAGGAVRITCGGYDEPEETLLERYGLVEDLPEAQDAKLDGRTLTFAGRMLTIGSKGELALSKNGRVLMQTAPDHVPATAPTLHRNAGYTFAVEIGRASCRERV